MKIFRMMLIAAMVVLVWHFVSDHPLFRTGPQPSAPPVIQTDQAGFADMISPDGTDPNKVLIIGPESGPSAEAQYCDDLAQQLTIRNIPFQRTSTHHLRFSSNERIDVSRLNVVMSGKPPIVFIHGHAKSDATIEEVLAEYRAVKP
jgi:hypothetical protein